jgi:hypothetical protein
VHLESGQTDILVLSVVDLPIAWRILGFMRFLLLALIAGTISSLQAQPTKPNVLFVAVDD